MNWMNGIIIIFFRQKKKQDASVSLIGNTCERRRRRKKNKKVMMLTRKKEARFWLLLFTHLLQENETFHLVRKSGMSFTKRCVSCTFTHVMFFFFLFFHALSLLQLLTMFQRWATLCVNVAGVSNNLNTRFERACRYFFFFFTFV